MSESDFSEFGTLLDGVCGLLSRGSYAPSASNTALFFRALSRYPLADVRAAFDAHVADPQRGRFVPVPADVIAQLEGMAADDGRLGADEAWAIAVQACDEAQTVVWTEDIAQAWGVARTIMDAGDEVGARVAFRDAYNRIVAQARRDRVPVQWATSLGFDQSLRVAAVKVAITQGRLPAPDVPLLEGPPATLERLIGSAPERVKTRLAQLRARLTVPQGEDEPSPDLQAKQRTDALRAEAAQLVAAYEGAP